MVDRAVAVAVKGSRQLSLVEVQAVIMVVDLAELTLKLVIMQGYQVVAS
jgi:hypothetical protein